MCERKRDGGRGERRTEGEGERVCESQSPVKDALRFEKNLCKHLGGLDGRPIDFEHLSEHFAHAFELEEAELIRVVVRDA